MSKNMNILALILSLPLLMAPNCNRGKPCENTSDCGRGEICAEVEGDDRTYCYPVPREEEEMKKACAVVCARADMCTESLNSPGQCLEDIRKCYACRDAGY